MARIRFKKPKIAILMSEVISLAIWLFLGDKVVSVLNSLVGTSYPINMSPTGGALTTLEGCTNASNFQDAFEILGLGYACQDAVSTTATSTEALANSESGLLGVIGLVMVVMVLMNFVTYN